MHMYNCIMEFPVSALLFILQLAFAAYPDNCMLLAELRYIFSI